MRTEAVTAALDHIGGKTKGHRFTRTLREKLDTARVDAYENKTNPTVIARNVIKTWTAQCVVEYLAANGANTQWAVDNHVAHNDIFRIKREQVPDEYTWHLIVQLRDVVTRPVAHHLWQKTRQPAAEVWRQAQDALK